MKRILLITSLSVLVMACSRTQLAYDNADWLLERYAGKTVKISAVQRERWQPVLADTLQRHRNHELPRLIAYLDVATAVISQADTSTGAGCLLDGIQFIAERHARLAVDLTSPLLADLDATQINHLREYTTERQQELVERYLDPDPEARQTSRQARFNDRLESWIGSISDEQRQLTEEALGRIPDLTPAWLAYRAQQTGRLLQLLVAGGDVEALEEYLNSWWVKREDRSPTYMDQWRIAKHEFTTFLTGLAPTLTDKQRSKLEKRLGKLRTELATLLPPDYTPVELMTADHTCAFTPA
jgi:hypothetical protein